LNSDVSVGPCAGARQPKNWLMRRRTERQLLGEPFDLVELRNSLVVGLNFCWIIARRHAHWRKLAHLDRDPTLDSSYNRLDRTL